MIHKIINVRILFGWIGKIKTLVNSYDRVTAPFARFDIGTCKYNSTPHNEQFALAERTGGE